MRIHTLALSQLSESIQIPLRPQKDVVYISIPHTTKVLYN